MQRLGHCDQLSFPLCAVWRGLEKENAEFFRQYLLKRTENRAKAFDQALEEATAKFCSQTLRADLHINGCGQSKGEFC
jgi:hypothetical protein